MITKTIFPMTRVHEPLKVDIEIQNGRVSDARIGGTLFRGFETMMIGRDPRDAALFTQRICGICSTAHAVADVFALQQAYQLEPTPNGQHLINLIFAADIIQNHLRHFYILAIYDYVKGMNMRPYVPRPDEYYLLPPKVNQELLAHISQGMMQAVRAHEMLAVFGGKIPMQQTIIPTGITEKASSDRIMAYSAILRELTVWVEKVYLQDVAVLAEYYKDYFSIGVTKGNMISYGMFPQPLSNRREIPAGVVKEKGRIEELDAAKIGEDIRYSWYKDNPGIQSPTQETTVPDRSKPDAYSWIKAPRYDGLPFEGGPLPRAWISGSYRRGTGTMDRIIARANETLNICKLAEQWLAQLVPNGATLRKYAPLDQGEGAGLTDAMRGPLGHWLQIKNSKISHYQIVTPTAWTFSPRDSYGQRGTVEEALVGTPVLNSEHLMEVGRVIRSFDPCFTCAVHLLDAPESLPVLVV